MKKSLVRVAGLTACLAMTSNAFGWWDGSHLMITEVATVVTQNPSQTFMSENAYTAIQDLLKETIASPGSPTLSDNTGTLPTAAIWADAIKLFPNQGQNYSTCHYIDVPIDNINTHISHETALSKVKAYSTAHNGEMNAITCLKSAIKTINTPMVEPQIKALALRLALHIVSDLAQPLHTASFGDRGGNNTVLQTPFEIALASGKTTSARNLHQIWDAGFGIYSQFTYSAAREKKGAYTTKELNYIKVNARELAELADYKALPINTRSEEVESLEDWVADSYEVAQNYAYSNLTLAYRDNAGKNYVTIVKDDAYHTANKWPAASQLYIGGVRLAKLMTALFDANNAEPGYVSMVNEITQDADVSMLPYE